MGRLDRRRHPWLLVTLVPGLPGDAPVTTESFRQFEQHMMGTPAWLLVPRGVQVMRAASIRTRRFLAAGNHKSSWLTGSPSNF